MKGLLPFLFAISLVACGWPTAGFAKADLQYTVRGYGAVSDYAFVNMNQPEFGLAFRVKNSLHEYLALHTRVAAKNDDPNGGAAGVLSVYVGDNLIHIHVAALPVSVGLYAGYQHLWYGSLYNNGIGGGLRLQTRIKKVTLTGKIGSLYGLSGTIGWHLACAGNDFVFYGRAAYPVTSHLSVFAFLRQERYVGDGNSLTARDAGLGLTSTFQ